MVAFRLVDRSVRTLVAVVVTAVTLAGGEPALAAQGARAIVEVSGIDDLYARVNDAANAGAVLVLAPGTYRLQPGQANGGRLELQENMQLVGQAGDPGLVVIDAADLPTASYQTPGGLTGPVRLGRGSNAIEWLTVQNDLAGSGLIETDLSPTAAPTSIRVAHAVLQVGQRGIHFRIQGTVHNGRVIEGVFEDNVIRDMTRGQAQGLRVVLVQGVAQATLRLTLRHNEISGNQVGLLATSLNASGNLVEISSTHDTFADNRAGCWLMGGIGAVSTSNVLRFTARHDTFSDNARPQTVPTYTTAGGVVALGGSTRGSSNLARVELLGCEFSGNAVADVSGFGYYDPTVPPPVGTNNRLELRIAGTPGFAVETLPSVPDDPDGTNEVVVLPPQPGPGT